MHARAQVPGGGSASLFVVMHVAEALLPERAVFHVFGVYGLHCITAASCSTSPMQRFNASPWQFWIHLITVLELREWHGILSKTKLTDRALFHIFRVYSLYRITATFQCLMMGSCRIHLVTVLWAERMTWDFGKEKMNLNEQFNWIRASDFIRKACFSASAISTRKAINLNVLFQHPQPWLSGSGHILSITELGKVANTLCKLHAFVLWRDIFMVATW